MKSFPDDFTITKSHEDGLRFRLGREAWLDRYFRAAMEVKSGLFVDVGANRGQTLAKVLAINPEAGYLGFEPQIDCCFYISEFIRENDLVNCRILPVGLSNAPCTVDLKSRSDDRGLTASTIDGFRPDSFYDVIQTIFVTEGDFIFNQMDPGPISVIKIDVEGGELEVLQGLSGTITKHQPIIFFEVLNDFLAVTGEPLPEDMITFRAERNRQLEKLIRDRGYLIFNLPAEAHMVEVEEIIPGTENSLDDVNFVAIPASASAKFREILKEDST